MTDPIETSVCEQCGGEFNPLTSYDHEFCNACFMASDLVDDSYFEDDEEDESDMYPYWRKGE